MWGPHGLRRLRFQVLEMFPFSQDGKNAVVPSLIFRKNGAQWRAIAPRISARSGHEWIFSRFSRSFLFQKYQSSVGKIGRAQATHQGPCQAVPGGKQHA